MRPSASVGSDHLADGRQGSLRPLLYVVFVLFSLLAFSGLIHHEPWGDEADPWLVAQDMSVAELLYLTGNTGHPALWYLVLMPFAKLGFPYITMQLIHWVIIASAAGLFLFRAPLPTATKVLVLSSAPMVFEYAVVARNYSLAVLLLFGCAALYRRRFDAPLLYGALIALLYNSSVLVFGGAAALSLLFAWECAREPRKPAMLAGLAVACLGALAAFLQMVPPRPDAAARMAGLFPKFQPGAGMEAVLNGMLSHGYWSELIPGSLNAIWSGQILQYTLLVFVLGTVAGLCRTVMTSVASRCFCFLSAAWLLYVFTFKYAGAFRHHAFLLISLIAALWIAGAVRGGTVCEIWQSRWTTVCLNLCLFASLVPGMHRHWEDYWSAYSPSRETARFIMESGYSQYRLVAMNHSFLPYLRDQLPEKKVWAILQRGYGSYHLFNETHDKRRGLGHQQRVARAIAAMPDRRETLLLLRWKLPRPQVLRAQPLWSTSALSGDLWVYRLEP